MGLKKLYDIEKSKKEVTMNLALVTAALVGGAMSRVNSDPANNIDHYIDIAETIIDKSVERTKKRLSTDGK